MLSLGTSVNSDACYKGKNMSKDSNREGCGRKRNGSDVYYKSCRNLNIRLTSICFLCEGDITRDVCNLTKAKKEGKVCYNKSNMDCFRRARHTRVESVERRGGIMVGAKAIASWGKIPRK